MGKRMLRDKQLHHICLSALLYIHYFTHSSMQDAFLLVFLSSLSRYLNTHIIFCSNVAYSFLSSSWTLWKFCRAHSLVSLMTDVWCQHKLSKSMFKVQTFPAVSVPLVIGESVPPSWNSVLEMFRQLLTVCSSTDFWSFISVFINAVIACCPH